MRVIASETKGATDYVASSAADFVKHVCWEVQIALRQRTLDRGSGRDSEGENA